MSKKDDRKRTKLPLVDKSFYIDEVDLAKPTLKKLEKDLRTLGATIEKFFTKDINYLITDHAQPADYKRRSAGATNSADGFPNTPSPFALTPNPAQVSPPDSKTLTTSRGSAILAKSMLAKASTISTISPSEQLVRNAKLWGVHILKPVDAMMWMEKKIASLQLVGRGSKSRRKTAAADTQAKPSAKSHGEKVLKSPYLKVDDMTEVYRPIVKKFDPCDLPFFHTKTSGCPFESKASAALPPVSKPCGNSASKVLDLPQDDRLPSATITEPTSTRQVKKSKVNNVKKELTYCMICKVRFDNQEQHLQSSQHRQFAVDSANYAALDTLISTTSSMQRFLDDIAKYRGEHIRQGLAEQEACKFRPVPLDTESCSPCKDADIKEDDQDVDFTRIRMYFVTDSPILVQARSLRPPVIDKAVMDNCLTPPLQTPSTSSVTVTKLVVPASDPVTENAVKVTPDDNHTDDIPVHPSMEGDTMQQSEQVRCPLVQYSHKPEPDAIITEDVDADLTEETAELKMLSPAKPQADGSDVPERISAVLQELAHTSKADNDTSNLSDVCAQNVDVDCSSTQPSFVSPQLVGLEVQLSPTDSLFVPDSLVGSFEDDAESSALFQCEQYVSGIIKSANSTASSVKSDQAFAVPNSISLEQSKESSFVGEDSTGASFTRHQQCLSSDSSNTLSTKKIKCKLNLHLDASLCGPAEPVLLPSENKENREDNSKDCDQTSIEQEVVDKILVHSCTGADNDVVSPDKLQKEVIENPVADCILHKSTDPCKGELCVSNCCESVDVSLDISETTVPLCESTPAPSNNKTRKYKRANPSVNNLSAHSNFSSPPEQSASKHKHKPSRSTKQSKVKRSRKADQSTQSKSQGRLCKDDYDKRLSILSYGSANESQPTMDVFSPSMDTNRSLTGNTNNRGSKSATAIQSSPHAEQMTSSLAQRSQSSTGNYDSSDQPRHFNCRPLTDLSVVITRTANKPASRYANIRNSDLSAPGFKRSKKSSASKLKALAKLGTTNHRTTKRALQSPGLEPRAKHIKLSSASPIDNNRQRFVSDAASISTMSSSTDLCAATPLRRSPQRRLPLSVKDTIIRAKYSQRSWSGSAESSPAKKRASAATVSMS